MLYYISTVYQYMFTLWWYEHHNYVPIITSYWFDEFFSTYIGIGVVDRYSTKSMQSFWALRDLPKIYSHINMFTCFVPKMLHYLKSKLINFIISLNEPSKVQRIPRGCYIWTWDSVIESVKWTTQSCCFFGLGRISINKFFKFY